LDIVDSLEDSNNIALFIFIEKQCLIELDVKQSYLDLYDNQELPAWDYLDQYILLYGDESQLGSEQKNYFDQDSYLNTEKVVNFKHEGNFSSAGHFPLLNGVGKFIGHIGVISDNTIDMKVIQQLLIRFVISYLLFTAVLFFLFYHYVHRLGNQLRRYFKALKDEVAERKLAETALKKFYSAVEHSGSMVMITDKSGKFEYVNPCFGEMTGYSAQDVIGKTAKILRAPRSNKALIKNLWETILAGKRWVNDIRNKKKNGELYWCHLTIAPIFDEENKISHFVGVGEDITQLKNAHDQMRHMAFFDALTQLPNRRLFIDRLKQTQERNTRNKTMAALFFLDLDKFKEINDNLGHAAGDELLKQVALILQALLRKSDTVARQGGDEFTLILDNISDVKGVEQLAQKIILKLSEPLNLMGTEVNISASIGITIMPTDGNSIEQLLKNADQAMYESKKRGRNRYSFYRVSKAESLS